MANQSLREFAIDFETKGTNLYISLASKTPNILGKHLFYSLAVQEVQHASAIDRMYLLSSVESIIRNASSIEAELKEFWQQVESVKLKNEPGDLSGYSLVMDMEKQSIRAYSEFLERATDEKEKEFLKWLVEEEKSHLEALRNVYYFLTETGDWLQGEESKIWNWMNQ